MSEVNTETLKHDAGHEIADLRKWLSDNDYKVNKYVLGEYTDESEAWIAYKAERAAVLTRVRELEAILAL